MRLCGGTFFLFSFFLRHCVCYGGESSLVEEQRFDAPSLEFWQLVADDLCQHLWELHAQGFIHKGVEAETQQTTDHLERTQEEETSERD